MKTAACSSCCASILWAVTKNEKRMPLDATPTTPAPGARGVFMLAKRTDETPLAWPLEITDGSEFGRVGLAMYISHFSTCPNASSHRRSGS